MMMDITVVKSYQNLAECLTKVPQRWLDRYKKRRELMPESCTAVTSQLNKSQMADIHQKIGHLGVKRTLEITSML